MSTATQDMLLSAGAVELRAAEGDKPATVSILAYGGGAMKPGGWGGVVVDLNGIALPEKVPLLADHRNAVNSIAGSGRPTVEGGKLVIDGELARGVDIADRVIALSKAGVRLAASVGLEVQRTEHVEAGETVTVNGRSFSAGHGLTVIRAARLKEVSLVGIGADSEAGITNLAARGQSMTTEHDVIDHEEVELERQSKIKAIFAKYSDLEFCDPTDIDKPVKVSTFRRNALRSNMTPAEVEVILMRAGLANGVDTMSKPAIHIRRPLEGDAAVEALSCAILRDRFNAPASFERNGKRYGLEAEFSEQVLEAADRRDMRNPSLHQLMDMTIRAADGLSYSGNRKSDDFLKTYVRAGMSLEASGGGAFSTLTVSHVLENVANKQLLMRFQMAAPVWSQIAQQKTLDDFKPATLYRLDENLGYLPLNPQGELQHGKLTDSKRTVQADTVGRMISLDRHHIINDDLDAFRQVVNGLADGAIWAIESAVAETLLANANSFFSEGNVNLIDDPLSIDGLTAAEIFFQSHVGEGGKPVIAEPSILLTGAALGVSARNLLAATPLLSVDGNAANVTSGSPFAGKFRQVTWRYVDVTSIRTPAGAAISNQSPSKWFLLSEPSQGSVVVVGLLNGRAVPTIESAQTDFNTLGMQWRGYHDFGVAQGDPEYGVMSTGDGSSE